MKNILIAALTLLSAMPAVASAKDAQKDPSSVSQSEEKTPRPLSTSTQEDEEELAYKEEYRPEALRQATRENSDEEQKKEKPITRNQSMRDIQTYGREFHEHNHDNH